MSDVVQEPLSEAQLAAHFAECQNVVRDWDRKTLLEGLYTTHTCTEGAETDNMRKAVLLRLDALSRVYWKRR